MSDDKNWILLKPSIRKAIHAAASSVITQGEIMTRASCPRKWMYRNALMLEKKGSTQEVFLIYGSLMHRLLEDYYASGMKERGKASEVADEFFLGGELLTPNQIEEVALAIKKVQIAFEAYCDYYQEADSKMVILSVEQEPEVFFEGLRFSGKIDLVSRPNGPHDGVFLWDYKTSFRLTPLIVDSWTFRFQFLFYTWLYWRYVGKKPDGIMVQGLLKPQIRPKKKENMNEFMDRIREEMTGEETRAGYFYRERIPLGADTLERFEAETLWPHIEAFKRLRIGGANLQALAMQQNTNQCHIYGSVCEFLRLCKDGWASIGEFNVREKKHSELSNGNEKEGDDTGAA